MASLPSVRPSVVVPRLAEKMAPLLAMPSSEVALGSWPRFFANPAFQTAELAMVSQNIPALEKTLSGRERRRGEGMCEAARRCR